MSEATERLERLERLGGQPFPFEVPGLRIDLRGMQALWTILVAEMRDCSFPLHAEPGCRYYFENGWFSFGDALIYRSLIKHLRPNQLVEVGSEFSSAVALDTRDQCGYPAAMTFIDPDPGRLRSLLKEQDMAGIEVIPTIVQHVDMTIFRKLSSGDFLFVDSSHILRIGSDVHFIFCEVLPLLAAGTIIHFHDAFWPFEYPAQWIVQEQRGYNELYFLQAFLTDNERFEIVFFNDYFAKMHAEIVAHTAPLVARNPEGGLWLRKLR